MAEGGVRMTDEQFFTAFPDRRCRIRPPERQLNVDKQRAVRYLDENELEFRSLGPHDKNRRRIIVWRVPEGNPYYDPARRKLLKVPFLLFADESVEDNDEILMPILHGIMEQARNRS
jgi:hypothetical protein